MPLEASALYLDVLERVSSQITLFKMAGFANNISERQEKYRCFSFFANNQGKLQTNFDSK
jgi:hypothetical protein